MKIEELLDNYFEGRTTREEERLLRDFFTSGSVPKHLEVYRPLFACLAQEAEAFQNARPRQTEKPVRRRFSLRHVSWLATGIAATVLLCVGVAQFGPLPAKSDSGCYVLIDGKRYDDPQLVQAKALEALREVSFSDEELEGMLLSPLP